jgi:hypothetical protein
VRALNVCFRTTVHPGSTMSPALLQESMEDLSFEPALYLYLLQGLLLLCIKRKRIMVAHARGSSEDNSEEIFCACQGLHRIEGDLGQVEELYCGNSTINPRLCKEAESAPGSAPTCVATTRPIEAWRLCPQHCFARTQLLAAIASAKKL